MRRPLLASLSLLQEVANLPGFMDPEAAPPKIAQVLSMLQAVQKKEHLIEHMKVSYHSVHQPKCGVCRKFCKSLESLRGASYCQGPEAIALDCEMVGGGSDGSLDLCAMVCIIDDDNGVEDAKKESELQIPTINTDSPPY